MNLFKAAFCRIFQFCFKVAIPILPYREPKLLTYDTALSLLKEKNASVLLVTDKGIRGLGLTKPLEDLLTSNNIPLCVFDETVANPTTKNVEDAYEMYKKNKCNFIVGFGGGSAMDCAKGVGVRVAKPKKPLSKSKGILRVFKSTPPIIAIPTTAGTGSETTLAAVIVDSETRHKYAIMSFPLIPKYAILDEKLTLGLPKHVTSTTGMDALTHAVEAYIGNSSTKKTRKYALEATKAIFENLPICYENGADEKARANMLNASYKAGLAFTISYVGYVHAIAHSLGGKYNIAHGLANAIILPHVLRRYGAKIHKKLYKMGVYAGLFDATTPIDKGAEIFISKIEEYNKAFNIPTGIDCIVESDILTLAKTAEKEGNPLYPVPVLYTAKQLADIYLEVKNG